MVTASLNGLDNSDRQLLLFGILLFSWAEIPVKDKGKIYT